MNRVCLLAAAACLVLLALTCVLWVRSYWVYENVYVKGSAWYQRYAPIEYSPRARSGRGGLELGIGYPLERVSERELRRIRDNFPRAWHERLPGAPRYPELRNVSGLGGPPPPPPGGERWFDWRVRHSRTDFASYRIDEVVLPYWSLALLFSGPPALWLVRRRRTLQRRTAGLCLRCGYDMRATPSRCPECGSARQVAP